MHRPSKSIPNGDAARVATLRDVFIDQSPVENITVQHVLEIANVMMRKGRDYLRQIGNEDIFMLPHGITMTVQGTWFDADIKLKGTDWSYHLTVRRGDPNEREVKRQGFLGHSARFEQDFITLKMMF